MTNYFLYSLTVSLLGWSMDRSTRQTSSGQQQTALPSCQQNCTQKMRGAFQIIITLLYYMLIKISAQTGIAFSDISADCQDVLFFYLLSRIGSLSGAANNSAWKVLFGVCNTVFTQASKVMPERNTLLLCSPGIIHIRSKERPRTFISGDI